jgi:hypothetical protein
MALNHLNGECKPLEVEWTKPTLVTAKVLDDELTFEAYEGEVSIPNEDESIRKLNHKHKTYEHNIPEYWNEILAYLSNLMLPENQKQ